MFTKVSNIACNSWYLAIIISIFVEFSLNLTSYFNRRILIIMTREDITNSGYVSAIANLVTETAIVIILIQSNTVFVGNRSFKVNFD